MIEVEDDCGDVFLVRACSEPLLHIDQWIVVLQEGRSNLQLVSVLLSRSSVSKVRMRLCLSIHRQDESARVLHPACDALQSHLMDVIHVSCILG